MIALVQVVCTALASWYVGSRLVRPRWCLRHVGLQVAVETALGILVFCYALYAASMFGYVTGVAIIGRPLLLVVFAAVILLAGLALPEARLAVGSVLRGAREDRVLAVGLGGALVYFGAMAVWCYLPAVGIDAIVYHLEVPKRILQVGFLPPFTDNVLAYYPMNVQMLYMFGLEFGGEAAAHLYHLLFGFLTMLAIYGYSRTLADRLAAVLATATFLAIPQIIIVGHLAYIDLAYTLYVFLALVVTIRYVRERQESERAAWKWAVLAGLLAGGAWSLKYTGLQLVLLLALMVLVEHLITRPRSVPFGLLALGGVAFVMFVPHLARTWWITGWPFFPFEVLPLELTDAVNWSGEQARLAMAWQQQYGAGYERTLGERLAAIYLVFVEGKFDYRFYDGILTPVYLLAPLALIRAPRERDLRMIAVFGSVFVFTWALTTTQVRFMLPILPAASALLAVLAVGRRGRLAQAALLVFIGLSLNEAYAESYLHKDIAYWRGEKSREEYITSRLPPYAAIAEANRVLGPGDRLYLVNGQTWGYYYDMPGDGSMTPFPNGWRADYTFGHYRIEKVLAAATSPDDVVAFFRDMGITHLLVNEFATFEDTGLGPSERRKFIDFMRRHAVEIFRNPADESQSLWKLQLDAAPARRNQ